MLKLSESPTKRPRVLHESAFRLAIAAQYDRVHKQAPVDEWFGGDGTIAAILKGITWLPDGSWGTVLSEQRIAQSAQRARGGDNNN